MGATALGGTHSLAQYEDGSAGHLGAKPSQGPWTQRQKFCWRHESELLQEEAQSQLPGHILPVVPTTGRHIFCHLLVSPFTSMTLHRTPL